MTKREIRRRAYGIASTIIRHETLSSELRERSGMTDDEQNSLASYLLAISNDLFIKSCKPEPKPKKGKKPAP